MAGSVEPRGQTSGRPRPSARLRRRPAQGRRDPARGRGRGPARPRRARRAAGGGVRREDVRRPGADHPRPARSRACPCQRSRRRRAAAAARRGRARGALQHHHRRHGRHRPARACGRWGSRTPPSPSARASTSTCARRGSPSRETVIYANAIWAGIDIIVNEHTNVVVEGVGIMGAFDQGRDKVAAEPDRRLPDGAGQGRRAHGGCLGGAQANARAGPARHPAPLPLTRRPVPTRRRVAPPRVRGGTTRRAGGRPTPGSGG